MTVKPFDEPLWQLDPENCCSSVKVGQLDRALAGKVAWMSGLRRSEAASRNGSPVNPLLLQGYASVGCQPCTSMPTDPDDPRSGRWVGRDKTECGIHE
jgi:phosphoadenosine phosphosulfate reductase